MFICCLYMWTLLSKIIYILLQIINNFNENICCYFVCFLCLLQCFIFPFKNIHFRCILHIMNKYYTRYLKTSESVVYKYVVYFLCGDTNYILWVSEWERVKTKLARMIMNYSKDYSSLLVIVFLYTSLPQTAKYYID